ncbi:MAG: type IV pilin protein, partial [Candidatus Binatia bacterium]
MPMKAHNGGFSLIEILVVIGAIGILLGIAVPAYNGYREKSQIAAAMHDLKAIETAIIA